MLAKNIRRGISVLSVARPDRDTESILAMADKHSETTFFILFTQYSQQMKKVDFDNYGFSQLTATPSKEEII
jgi:hypothetical protein